MGERATANGALNTLQAGRAFAALAVLAFHVELTLALKQYLGHAVFPFFNSGYSGVHFFFVLSGFVIMLAHHGDIGRPEQVAGFAWKRFRRIYPPLWAALLIVLPLTLMIPALNNGAPVGIKAVLSAVTLVPARYDPLLSVIWTLRHEALFYLVFGLAIWKPKIGLTVGALWMLLSAVLPWFGVLYPLRFFFTSQHLLFAFGAGAFLLFQRGKVRWPLATLIAGLVLFAATWAIPLLKLPIHGVIGNWTFGLGAALAILGAATLERERGFPVPRVLVFLGEASYAIYLVHAPAIYAVCMLAMLLPPQARRFEGLLFLVAALVGLGVGVAFHLLVEKPLLARIVRMPGRPRPPVPTEAAAP